MKRSWKQTGSLFMVVCMVLTMLPAVVLAETDARDSGAPMLQSGILPMGSGAVTGRLSIGSSVAVTDLTDNGNGSSGMVNWAWNAATATLTLENNGTATTPGAITFDSTGDVTITVPSGKSADVAAIAHVYMDAGKLTINGGGTLNVLNDEQNTVTIEINSDLEIADVTVNVMSTQMRGNGVCVGGSFSMNSAALDISTTEDNSYGLRSNGNIDISGDTLNVTSTGVGLITVTGNISVDGGTVDVTSNANRAIEAAGVVLVSRGSLTAKGSGVWDAIYGGGVTVSGGTLTTGGNGDCGDIYCSGTGSVTVNQTDGTANVTINGGINSSSGPSTLSVSAGTVTVTGNIDGDLTVSDGAATVKGYVCDNLTVSGGEVIVVGGVLFGTPNLTGGTVWVEGVKLWPADTTYTATLNIRYNDVEDPDDTTSYTLKLSTNEAVAIDMTGTGATRMASIPNGIWNVYVGQVGGYNEDTNVTVTINNSAASAQVDWYYFEYSAVSQGTARDGIIDLTINGESGSGGTVQDYWDLLKGCNIILTATGTGADNYAYAWSGTHGGTAISGTGNSYTIGSLQGIVNIVCTITGSDTVPSITTSEALKTELEKTTPAIIDVTENITLSESISVNADHTLNIAPGKTINTANNQITIPDGKILTLSGQGTLKANNPTSNSIGIKVAGTLQMNAESKLVAANTGTGSSGIMLGMDNGASGGYNPGTLISNAGRITVENSGNNSVGINSGNGAGNDSVTLNGGTLTVKNTAGIGIFADNLSIQNQCAVNVENSIEINSKGICAADLLIKDCASVTIANPAGFGIFVQPDSTFTVDNSTLSVNGALGRIGISLINDDTSGASMLLKNNSGLIFNNTAGYGLWMDPDATLQVDASLVRVSANGGTGIYWANTSGDIEFHGANNGKVSLAIGARLVGPKSLFSDRGMVCTPTGAVEVVAEGRMPSDTVLTSGEYVWNGSVFAKGSPTEITGFEPIPNENVGRAGSTICTNVAEVLNLLQSSNPYAIAMNIDPPALWLITGWEDTDGYNPAVAGSYTFTATLGAAPAGYANSAGHQVTVEVVVSLADDGNGGDSGDSTTTPPTASAPVTPTATPTSSVSGSTATTTVTTTTDTDGKAAASVPAAQVDSALKQAQDAAAKSGEAPKVEIKVEAPADATALETAVPQAAMAAIASGKLQDLTISSPVANLTFDGAALNTIAGAAAGDVKFSASKVNTADLPAAVQTLLGNRPVYEFSVTSGDNTISRFNGNVTVAVPYQLGAGEDPNAVIISYINTSGNLEVITNGRYDSATGTVIFTTDHFSKYAVGYSKVSFSDVADTAWYSDAVSFIAAREITTGTGDNKYSPEAKLTRGEFIVLMMRAYGIAPDTDPTDNFLDAGNTYYTGYLSAAKRLGISAGVGSNMYTPNKEITRQEMFALLYNTLKVIGQLPQGDSGKALSDFADAGQVDTWAVEAMKLLVETGAISGSGGKLSPTSTTTRAEMAQVLYKLLSK